MKKLRQFFTIIPVCLLFSACSILDSEYYAEEIPTFNSQSAQESALRDALQARIEKEIIQAENLPLQYQYMNALLSTISFDILSVDEVQHIMIIRCSFVDVMVMADTFGDAELTLSEYYQQCMEQIQNESAPVMETRLVIAYEETLEQGERVFAITQSEGLSELLSCGVYSATKELLSTME